jgi:hypothetical protein
MDFYNENGKKKLSLRVRRAPPAPASVFRLLHLRGEGQRCGREVSARAVSRGASKKQTRDENGVLSSERTATRRISDA